MKDWCLSENIYSQNGVDFDIDDGDFNGVDYDIKFQIKFQKV